MVIEIKNHQFKNITGSDLNKSYSLNGHDFVLKKANVTIIY